MGAPRNASLSFSSTLSQLCMFVGSLSLFTYLALPIGPYFVRSYIYCCLLALEFCYIAVNRRRTTQTKWPRPEYPPGFPGGSSWSPSCERIGVLNEFFF
ncbi:hypothetical protein BGX38DRAFT_336401 [Terfezia claveryi]|nr:hypothetical protein BGX38DRAFT_336401 [Terfezia claveryi]